MDKTKLLVSFSVAVLAFLMGSVVEAQSEDDLLQVRVKPAYFSPNGDDLQDKTFFSPVLRSDKEVTRWRLDIRGGGTKKSSTS